MVSFKAFPSTPGLSPSSLPEIMPPPADTKVTASLGALRAQISIPGMKVKAMQGTVAVQSFSRSSWTIENLHVGGLSVLVLPLLLSLFCVGHAGA